MGAVCTAFSFYMWTPPPARSPLSLPSTTLPLPPPSPGHNYIGTEHILLGLLREGEGVASRVLETLGADPQKIRTQVGYCAA